MWRELRGLSASLAAQKGAKAKLETKVSQWEARLVEVREMGGEDRIAMAEHSLRKAKKKVEEKEEAIVALYRSVWRMETILAAEVDKVKEEEVEDVVEVKMEAEEMVEETVKEEVEAKVVVETAVGERERVAEVFFGVEGCGGHPGPAMGPGRPGWPTSPNPEPAPPRRPGESGLDSPVFVAAGAPRAVGGGKVGMGGRRGVGPTGQAHAAGGGPTVVGVATGVAREQMGGDVPTPRKWG